MTSIQTDTDTVTDTATDRPRGNDPMTTSNPTTGTNSSTGSVPGAKPRFRTGQLIFGLALVGVGLAALLSSTLGAPVGTTLAAVVLIEAGVVFWLVRRNRKLLNAMIAAATPVSTLTGDAAGPDPELVKAAMAELDEIDAPSDPRLI